MFLFIQQLGIQISPNVTLLAEPWQQGAVIIAVIAFSFFLSVLRFRVTQNFVNIVFVAYGGAIVLVGLAGLLWLFTGHTSQTNFALTQQHWLPNGSTASLYGLIILALLGIEVPLNMGVEINNMRSITRYLLWGSVVVMLAYLIGTFGVQVAVPVKDQPNPSAIAEAVQTGIWVCWQGAWDHCQSGDSSAFSSLTRPSTTTRLGGCSSSPAWIDACQR